MKTNRPDVIAPTYMLLEILLLFNGCERSYHDTTHTMRHPTYVFPGCFCPPTYGHLFVVEQAAAFLPEVTIVCSTNPDKKNPWFSPEQCKKFWHSYALPSNVKVTTFAEIEPHIKDMDLVMIRGIRNEKDFDQEKKVMVYNAQHYGISKVLYIVHTNPHEHVYSSSYTRALAEDLHIEVLGKYVSPLIISALLEKVLNVKNIFMVVGKTGAGKTTFLNMLHALDETNIVINTDEFNHQLRPLIQEHFKGENLIDVALNKEEEMLKLITKPWLELLKQRLKAVPPHANVFLEIAYGLLPSKAMYRYVGGKVLYVGCNDMATNISRITSRGTPQHKAFIEKTPDLKESQRIAQEQKLELLSVNTDCSLNGLHKKAEAFNNWLKSQK